MMVVTVCPGGDELSLQILLYRLIRISGCAGAQLHARLGQRSLGSAADTAADQHVNGLIRQKICQRAMAGAVGTDDLTGGYLTILHVIYLEELRSPKMLKHFSVFIIISHCYFHFFSQPFLIC